MEATAERDEDEVYGVDLVARRSKHRTHHAGHADFAVPTPGATGGGTYDSDSNGERVENASRSVVEEEVEGTYESKSYVASVESESRSVVEGELQAESEDEEEVHVVAEAQGKLLVKNNEDIFLGENEGSESPNDLSRMENQVVSHFLPMENNSDHIVENASIPKSYQETDNKYLEISRDESSNTFITPTAETSNERGMGVNVYINETAKPDESSVLEETEIIPEFDVERVIEKQETHDLFCPNCNSCITKRVILRRRERKIQERSGGGEIVITENDRDRLLPNTGNDSPPDVFRCLSCFSFFIPIGEGFKSITVRIWGSKDDIGSGRQPSASGTSQEEHPGVVSVQEQRPVKSPSELLLEQEVTEDRQGELRIPIDRSEVPRAGGVSQLDIIKSIVYGGLLESTASLSVVTSAAGADTKTLSVLALGAANMIGGLFVLAHNLRVLKHETSNERYKEVLGRPGHFTLHATVAVISYLVFGLIPPVIYGFTFRESDNRDYKLIAVASASFLCIIVLALGKAYTRRPPKSYMKTVLYYISLWVMACGVSYFAGDLLDLLLEKLGLFESSSSVGEVRLLKAPWASY